MKAMIFAAGLGTRLKPLTDKIPKALVKVAGKPMLQRTLEHLKKYGFTDIIINVHHFADQVEEFLSTNKFDLNIQISDERKEVLDTGGGLKKATWFFNDSKPFLVINADIISDMDLNQLYYFHWENSNLVTIVIRNRPSGRCFLFNEDLRLCGWRNNKTGEQIIKIQEGKLVGYPFSGIHIVNPAIFDNIDETGKFSIVDVYLRLAATRKIYGYLDNSPVWFDIGDSHKLRNAENALKNL